MIRTEEIKKQYGDKQVLKGISTHIEQGEVLVIIGPSGSGKSTFLRCLNRLEKTTAGKVIVDGYDLTDKNTDLNFVRQEIGMVFQHFNLFPHLTIKENITLAPVELGRETKEDADKHALELLGMVGLEDKANSYPSQLSGGQKQRVAIARALANDPDVLLCDEATSALDPKTTYSILELLKKVNEQLGITIVIITHEMQVVKEICNKVAVMEDGEVIEQGTVLDIFTNPQRNLTKDFIDTATHINQGIETVLSHEQLLNLRDGDYLVKISFVGASTGEPLITKLSTQFQVAANILFANVEIIQETPVGTLLVGLSGEQESIESALSYIKGQGVSVDVLEEKGGA